MRRDNAAPLGPAAAVAALIAVATSFVPAALDAAAASPTTTTTTTTTPPTTTTTTAPPSTPPTTTTTTTTTTAAPPSTSPTTTPTTIPTTTAAPPSTSPTPATATSAPGTGTTSTNPATTTTTTTTVPADPLALLDASPQPSAEFLVAELQRWQQSATRRRTWAATPGAGDLQPGRAPLVSRIEDEHWIAAVLATIRTVRSGGAYDASPAAPGGAAGAYGYSDAAWDDHEGYPTARLAPPDIQDARARADVVTILLAFAGDVSSVPRHWERVAVDGDTEWLELPPVEPRPEVEVEADVDDPQPPYPFIADARLPGPSVADTQLPHPFIADARLPGPSVADLRRPNTFVADDQPPDPSTADAQSSETFAEAEVADWLRSFRVTWGAIRNGGTTVDEAPPAIAADDPTTAEPVTVEVTSLPDPSVATTTTTLPPNVPDDATPADGDSDATASTATSPPTTLAASTEDEPESDSSSASRDAAVPADDPGLLSVATIDAAWRALPPATVPHGPDYLRSITFPVLGPARYGDGWGDPRDGGLRRHQGTDIIGVRMQPLLAAADGVLTRVAPATAGISGGALSIRDADGWRYNYFHLNNDTPGTDDGAAPVEFRMAVGLEPGDSVVAGQIIGYMGDSGNAEGSVAHVHFEIRDPSGAARPSYWSLRNAEARQACSIGIGPWSIVNPPDARQSPADPLEEGDLEVGDAAHTKVAPLFGDGWWSIDTDGRVVAVGDAALIIPSPNLDCDDGPADLYGSDAGGWYVLLPPPADEATDPAEPEADGAAPSAETESAGPADGDADVEGEAAASMEETMTTEEAVRLARAQVPPGGLDAPVPAPAPDEPSEAESTPDEEDAPGPQLAFIEPTSGDRIIINPPPAADATSNG